MTEEQEMIRFLARFYDQDQPDLKDKLELGIYARDMVEMLIILRKHYPHCHKVDVVMFSPKNIFDHLEPRS